MTLNERAEEALAQWKAGHITHGLQLEMVELVREYHKQASDGDAAPLAVSAPTKAPDPNRSAGVLMNGDPSKFTEGSMTGGA